MKDVFESFPNMDQVTRFRFIVEFLAHNCSATMNLEGAPVDTLKILLDEDFHAEIDYCVHVFDQAYTEVFGQVSEALVEEGDDFSEEEMNIYDEVLEEVKRKAMDSVMDG